VIWVSRVLRVTVAVRSAIVFSSIPQSYK